VRHFLALAAFVALTAAPQGTVALTQTPAGQAPKPEPPKTVLDTDHEFDGGSKITFDTLSAAQIDNLTMLGKVWGFLKYHHPAITSGSRHWDYDLFRVLPGVLSTPNRNALNAALSKWVAGLGVVSPCAPCAVLRTETLHLSPDVQWIQDEARLGRELSGQLRAIHANRRAAGPQFYISLAPNIGFPVFSNEPAYPVQHPDAGFQLLAVYRFWNIIEYWFPYRDVIGEDWDIALKEFIPRVATARTTEAYHRELIGLIARVHDTHANLWSALAARPPVGPCQVPAKIRFIEDRPVVTQAGSGLSAGDIITAIDGVPVTRLVEEWSPYYAASNVPTRLRDIASFMMRGACGDATIGLTRGSQALTVKATRAPVAAPTGPPTHDLPGDTFRKLSDDVGYLKLSTIKAPEAAGFLKAAEGTKGIVIDIRNYPSTFVVFALGNLLVSEPTTFARFTQGDLSTPGAFHWGPSATLMPAAPRYTGKVVILLDEISQSQSEYTAMAFRSSPNARIVGSTTAGADGNVSAIPLPGNVRSMISGIGVFYPDKRPTQRVGIIPDVVVRPSVAGVRDGRDEVLEAGIREILGPGASEDAIRKMIAGGK
jgi:C-terminal processing protease CtpA/Prc